MRTYSKDLLGEEKEKKQASKSSSADVVARRCRTRSADLKEEQEAVQTADQALSVAEWHTQHAITIRGHGTAAASTEFPDPYRNYSDTPFGPRILESFVRAGFAAPTAIQAQSWPIALQQKDMICVAKTGSGST